MTGGNVRGNSKPPYVCRKRPNHLNACGKISVSGLPADALVAEEVAAFLNDRERVRAPLATHTKGTDLEAINERQRGLSESKDALEVDYYTPPLA